jgi:hypothetical protein
MLSNIWYNCNEVTIKNFVSCFIDSLEPSACMWYFKAKSDEKERRLCD